MELQVVENEIIKIYKNDEQRRLVNARELHKALGSQRQFADWIKDRIRQYKFVENEDFLIFSQICEKMVRGRPTKEYYLTIDTAKEICMIENNEMGRRIRKYFIEAEKRLQMIMSVSSESNDLLSIIKASLKYTDERFEIIEKDIKEMNNQIQSINITIRKITEK